jgi:hypothetical protein
MTTTIVGRYLTPSGKVGAEIRRHEIGTARSYSWTGEWGAGSGGFNSIFERIKSVLRHHPRHRVELAWQPFSNPEHKP